MAQVADIFWMLIHCGAVEKSPPTLAHSQLKLGRPLFMLCCVKKLKAAFSSQKLALPLQGGDGHIVQPLRNLERRLVPQHSDSRGDPSMAGTVGKEKVSQFKGHPWHSVTSIGLIPSSKVFVAGGGSHEMKKGLEIHIKNI